MTMASSLPLGNPNNLQIDSLILLSSLTLKLVIASYDLAKLLQKDLFQLQSMSKCNIESILIQKSFIYFYFLFLFTIH